MNSSVDIDYHTENKDKKSVNGTLSTDTVIIPGNYQLAASDQLFALVYKVNDFDLDYYDGIFGLGLSADGNPSLIENLKAQGSIEEAVFSLYLNDNGFRKDDDQNLKSALTLGYWDIDKYGATDLDLKWFDVLPNSNRWELNLTSIHVADSKVDLETPTVVFDSRRSHIIGPKDGVDTLYERFRTQYGCSKYHNRMACDCSNVYNIVSWPEIIFKLDNDEEFKLTDKEYFRKQSRVCFLLVEAEDVDYWVLGDVFLRKFYSVYNFDERRIGLMPSKSSRTTSNLASNWWIIPTGLAGLSGTIGLGYLIWKSYGKTGYIPLPGAN